MSDKSIPMLPESAPFTVEQRAYLNGFFAGLFSRTTGAGGMMEAVAQPLQPLSIVFGSQTGNCERLAKRIAKEAGKCGFAPTIHDFAKYSVTQLASESKLLIVTSTYGDGEPPDNAKAFWDALQSEAAAKLLKLRFSICALGDSNYTKFCGFGKELEARLERMGAKSVHARVDCDVEFEQASVEWMHGALYAMSGEKSGAVSSAPSAPSEPAAAEAGYSRTNPFAARLVTNRKLNAAGAEKDVRHFEISLEGSGLSYEVGDALGIMPQNDSALVTELIAALGFTADEKVTSGRGETSLREALGRDFDISRIPKPLLEVFAERTDDALLKKVSLPDANGELTKFLWGREIIDLVAAYPQVRFSPAEFVKLLRKLQPRLYSISSSLKAHPNQVHLTVGAVRYESLGRQRWGVCSTFLADRVVAETPVPVFVQENKAFRPPAADVPLIMVGPGTGVAPFRAFLEERKAIGAKGKNWLFFGDQRSTTDFLYREEIEVFQRDGLLTRLDLAWSRDQGEKIYVQQRMLEQAKELFAWLEEGGAFYVCGDASRMAKDVDAALHEVIQCAGSVSAEQAAEYVAQLKTQKRYKRDVY
jgi:sulfite reductase (NADPH) flavoprotein alpha-component